MPKIESFSTSVKDMHARLVGGMDGKDALPRLQLRFALVYGLGKVYAYSVQDISKRICKVYPPPGGVKCPKSNHFIHP